QVKDAGAGPDAVGDAASSRGAVDRARGARQRAGQGVRRQVEVGEVEQVVETHARLELNDMALQLNLVGPAQLHVKGPQRTQVLLPLRCGLQGAIRTADAHSL